MDAYNCNDDLHANNGADSGLPIPTDLPVATAQLPTVYLAASTALQNCARIDECKDWSDKAQALASYARQADDDALWKLAKRIQARAVRRCGELLKQFHSPGARTDQPKDVTVPRSQKEAGAAAGLSERQIKTAVAVAKMPESQFEAEVGSEAPPTVSKLAEGGTNKAKWDPPEGFEHATKLLGTIRRFAEFCKEHEPETIANGLMASESAGVRATVSVIDGWLDRLVVNLKESTDELH